MNWLFPDKNIILPYKTKLHMPKGIFKAIDTVRIFILRIAKSPELMFRAFGLFDAAVSYSRMGDPTLPSALRRFTSEFGMGSGGTTALLPPGKFCFIPTASLSCRHQNQSRNFAENLSKNTFGVVS